LVRLPRTSLAVCFDFRIRQSTASAVP